MKVLVCGGREYADVDHVNRTLAYVDATSGPIRQLIHGAARGADTLAASWAYHNKIEVRPYPADWTRDGKAAGPIRNQRMLDDAKPDLVIAFAGGRGTADMISRALKAGVKVVKA